MASVPEPKAQSDPPLPLKSEEATRSQPDRESNLPQNERLRIARGKAGLSRTATAQRLKQQGVQLTADGIKKQEEGKAKPKPDAKKAYAIVYETTEAALFDK